MKIAIKRTTTTDIEVFAVKADNDSDTISGAVLRNRIGLTSTRHVEFDILDGEVNDAIVEHYYPG